MTTRALSLSYLYGVGKRYQCQDIDAARLLMLDLVGLVGLVSNRLTRLSFWLLRWSRWGLCCAPPNAILPQIFGWIRIVFFLEIDIFIL